jgi:hypothetical protein
VIETTQSVAVLRKQLEKCARKYHVRMQEIDAPPHKFWKFEECPAGSCREARAALGIPQPAPIPKDAPREPGCEG